MKMRTSVTDFTKDGACSRCGQCCSDFLPLSDREIRAIRKYIRSNGIKEQKHNIMSMQAIDVTCPFRDESTKSCLIYEIRPQICRSFMCNHTEKDIQQKKEDFHKLNKVIHMRKEFYGGGGLLMDTSELICAIIENRTRRGLDKW